MSEVTFDVSHSEILIVNDIHLSDQVPSSCTATYLDDLLDLLVAIGEIATKRNAESVIWAGDVFHHKTPARTSHATIMRVIEILRAYPCRVWVVPGNHDIQHDRLDSLHTTQPLGVLIASGALHVLSGWMTYSTERGDWWRPVYGVPWLSRFTNETVRDALTEYRVELARTDTPMLVVTHAPLYPPGRELPYEYYPAADWADAMHNRGTVHYGHVHEPHGVYIVNGVHFSNCGALSRGSLTEKHATRPILIAAWNPVTGGIHHIDVPHKPASEVFRLAEVAAVKTAAAKASEFLDAVGRTSLEVTSVEVVIDHVRAREDLDDELKEITVQLLRDEAAP